MQMQLVIDIYNTSKAESYTGILLGYSKLDSYQADLQHQNYWPPNATCSMPPRCINLRVGVPGQLQGTSDSANSVKAIDIVKEAEKSGVWPKYDNMTEEAVLSRAKTTKAAKKRSALGLYRQIGELLSRPGKKKREQEVKRKTHE